MFIQVVDVGGLERFINVEYIEEVQMNTRNRLTEIWIHGREEPIELDVLLEELEAKISAATQTMPQGRSKLTKE